METENFDFTRKDDAIATDRKNEAAEKRKRRSPHTARAGAAHDEHLDF